MRPWTTWLCGLGLSGALALGLAGCGGGDVPDPSSDELAADDGGDAPAEPSLPPPAQAAAPAPAGDAAPAPAAAPPAATASAPGEGPVAPAVAAPASPPAAQEATASAAPAADAQAAAKSETAELLAAASGTAAPASAVADAAPAPGSPAGPGSPGAPGAEPDAGQLAYPGGMNPAALNGPGGEAAARGAFGPGGGRDGSLGMPTLGGSGGASELKPGDTNTPHGAVEAFLYALAHKDRDRLAEATALRANTVEEGGKFKELFSRIIDTSISDSELDDLASKLEGFRDSGENQVKSTGRLGVTIRKELKDGGWLQRTVTVRKEKKGWGVLDISGPTEFDNARARNAPRRR